MKLIEKKNPLVELAERLDRVGIELCCDELDEDSKDAIRKAQRIVAELAKFTETNYFEASELRLFKTLINCRAIAEEGAKDE